MQRGLGLPAPAGTGYLNAIDTKRGLQEQTFTLPSYGHTERGPTGADGVPAAPDRPVHPVERARRRLQPAAQRQRQEPGGRCNCDSGGPVFRGGYGSDIIVPINGFALCADKVCTGNDYAYRTERRPITDWIRRTVPAAQVASMQIVQP